MNRLITASSKPELIELYRTSPHFHSIVRKHEELGSTYETMLEEAVIYLGKSEQDNKKTILEYAHRFGVISNT